MENVIPMLKQIVQQSTGYNRSTADVWGSFRRGVPGQAVSLMLAQLEAWSQKVLPFSTDSTWDSVEEVLDALYSVFGALWEFLGNFNPLDPNFDPEEAFQSFIDAIVAVGDFLTALSPLNAENLFNLVPKELIAELSVSSIGDTLA